MKIKARVYFLEGERQAREFCEAYPDGITGRSEEDGRSVQFVEAELFPSDLAKLLFVDAWVRAEIRLTP